MNKPLLSSTYKNHRVDDSNGANAFYGNVILSKQKLSWLGFIFLVSLIGGVLTASMEALLVLIISTAISLCFGHSLGMHRKLIHQSYQCPKWLEYLFVHFGVLVGLAGPFGMIRTHDLRDWAQRKEQCHAFFGHKSSILKDAYWQLFCDVKLERPPHINIETSVSKDPIYQLMEKTWMLQQLPWLVLFFILGGITWVIWGVFIRISVSVLGHWLIGYFAHNQGQMNWHVEGASIQGYNIRFAALITMGESWHNNHHAFPGSAKLGLYAGEIDPGWIVLLLLRKLGLVWQLKEPKHLAIRPELNPAFDRTMNTEQ